MTKGPVLRHLFDFWEPLKADLRGRAIFVFLDYDGTLTPIVATPEKAVLSPENKILLQRLAASARCRVAIVSGRALKDIQERVGLKNVIYVGNHGFEIAGPEIDFK